MYGGMTFGGPPYGKPDTRPRIGKGPVTLHARIRKNLGIKKGDLVSVTETPEGVVITHQKVVASKEFDEIEAILNEHGLTLEEIIESGREIRGELLREMYGIEPVGSNSCRPGRASLQSLLLD